MLFAEEDGAAGPVGGTEKLLSMEPLLGNPKMSGTSCCESSLWPWLGWT